LYALTNDALFLGALAGKYPINILFRNLSSVDLEKTVAKIPSFNSYEKISHINYPESSNELIKIVYLLI
jgi:hypothetical protein